jgi:hypothetical protein
MIPALRRHRRSRRIARELLIARIGDWVEGNDEPFIPKRIPFASTGWLRRSAQ